MRLERLDLKLERPDLRPERPDLRPERPEKLDQGDKRTNRRMDKQKSPCVLQDFVPFGAAAHKQVKGLCSSGCPKRKGDMPSI